MFFNLNKFHSDWSSKIWLYSFILMHLNLVSKLKTRLFRYDRNWTDFYRYDCNRMWGLHYIVFWPYSTFWPWLCNLINWHQSSLTLLDQISWARVGVKAMLHCLIESSILTCTPLCFWVAHMYPHFVIHTQSVLCRKFRWDLRLYPIY